MILPKRREYDQEKEKTNLEEHLYKCADGETSERDWYKGNKNIFKSTEMYVRLL